MAGRRSFRSLRGTEKRDRKTVTGNAQAAFQSISQTEQGDAIREYLAMIVCDTSRVETEGAWMEQQARRIFAEQIIQMMDGGKNGHQPGHDADREQ
jgi:hypothetical protein